MRRIRPLTAAPRRSWASATVLGVTLCALVGCTGEAEISIGAAAAASFFISPQGADDAAGTRESPWRTFTSALSRLGPGTTLVLLEGTYEAAINGPLEIRCGVNATNGTTAAPITIRADEERKAFLKGNGLTPPFVMEGCSHWVIDGLRAESADVPTAPTTPEAGSIFVLGMNNHHIVLRRLLAARPNRHRHSHVLRVGDNSSDLTMEECELYDFHHNGFEVLRSTAIVFRRNYVNSRNAIELPGYDSMINPARGDYGFIMEETRFAVVEDNIAEGMHHGFGLVGRYKDFPSDPTSPTNNPIDGNRLVGNVALESSGSGFLLESRCLAQNPCVDRTRVIVGTELEDNVAIGGAFGLLSTGSIDTKLSQFTAIDAAVGVALDRSPDNVGISSSSFTFNALAVGFQTAGFLAKDQTAWRFDHCTASGGSGATFSPNDAHVTATVALDPGLGSCLVYLPASSPLRRAGAFSLGVGAQVVYRHQGGLPTANPLWDPSTGAFPCGAVIPGVNDDPAQSCIGVHQRLHVGQAGCPLP